MPRQARKVPAYTLHKASRRAVVRLDGRDHYLGEYGSEESYAEYERVIGEWRLGQSGTRSPGAPTDPAVNKQMTVSKLILRYLQYARTYYVKDGMVTYEFTNMKYALRPLRKLYGHTQVSDFGPLALKAVREYIIDVEDLSRGVVNNRINRETEVTDHVFPETIGRQE